MRGKVGLLASGPDARQVGQRLRLHPARGLSPVWGPQHVIPAELTFVSSGRISSLGVSPLRGPEREQLVLLGALRLGIIALCRGLGFWLNELGRVGLELLHDTLLFVQGLLEEVHLLHSFVGLLVQLGNQGDDLRLLGDLIARSFAAC